MIAFSWRRVKPEAIRNCWRKAGFVPEDGNDSSDPEYDMDMEPLAIVWRVQGKPDKVDDNDDDTLLVPEKAICHVSALQWTKVLMDYLQQQDAPLAEKLVLQKICSVISKR
ncbi:hypothetical protein C0J52_21441 [Blattella germanica]|nr:hypothetical protein C0J52_21441 [Blattella germanica]